VFDRHIADSLAFLTQIGTGARTIVDVGSGVGLPAIPIAISLPEVDVTIVDRSERRTRLARRALRILALENVGVVTADAADVRDTFDVVTFRAALPVASATKAYLRLSNEDGVGILAWSRRVHPRSPPAPPSGTIFTLVSEGEGVLDSPAWLLRMERRPTT
jgi:16S rRNA (guanine(527)-N(7))-methyltransferase RsmG